MHRKIKMWRNIFLEVACSPVADRSTKMENKYVKGPSCCVRSPLLGECDQHLLIHNDLFCAVCCVDQ